MNSKQVFAALGLLIILGIVFSIWRVAIRVPMVGVVGSGAQSEGEGVVCTADAMQCSDGSWVGRSGPNCEFVCPIPTSSGGNTKGTNTVEARINQKVTPLSEGITVLQVVDDSRCPKSVQCIQAGTVRVLVLLETGMGNASQTFTLGKPITTETETITLVGVRPEKETPGAIEAKDYRFTFTSVSR